jgi:aminopeptidase N
MIDTDDKKTRAFFLQPKVWIILALALAWACSIENSVGSAILRKMDTPVLHSTPTASESPTSTAGITPSLTSTPTVLSAAEIGAPGIGDPYFPDMGNGGYDVRHYDLSIAVDLTAKSIQAKAEISAHSLQMLARFDLDFKGLTVDSVEVNGAQSTFIRAQSELVVTPADPIPDGADFTVTILYNGEPINGTQSDTGDYVDGWNFYPGGVVVAGEPGGAETWFPSNNHPSDKATYAFHITVDQPLVVAANGVLRGRTEGEKGTWTYDWTMDEPMASYLATVAISNFSVTETKSPKGVPIRNYVDADIPAAASKPLEVLPEAVDFFNSLFGAYPFDACGAVIHEFPLYFSLEDQTLIIFGDTFINDIVVVHELSHQWFGDSVSLKDWKDIWLNEGFASYAEALWLEHTQGAGAMRKDLERRYRNLPSAQDILIGDPGPDHLFDEPVYDRGALTLHALRLELGDDTFFQILRTYFERYRDGNAASADFIAVAEAASGRNLTDFFQAWLYRYPLPDIPELD